MFNLFQKIHALMTSDAINIWHFPVGKDLPFVYWLSHEPDDAPGHQFATLEEMVNEAFAHIDLFRKKLPKTLPEPPQVKSCPSVGG